MKTSGTILTRRRILSGLLLALTLAAPAGAVDSVIRGQGAEPVEVAVAERKERQMVDFTPTGARQGIVVPAGPGKTVKAGPGKTVKAGPETGHWRTYDVTDGLAEGAVYSMLQDRNGHLWLGTRGGVSRYDGKSFTTFTTKDGLADNSVCSVFQDREGYLWFGTGSLEDGGSGISRYDGQRWLTFAMKDGLADNSVCSVFQDREGYLWFGTRGGVSRYDGKSFTTFTTKDGLIDNFVSSIFQDREGHIWFGTLAGLSRYDPSTLRQTQGSGGAKQKFTTFTTKDGLVGNAVRSIFQDREGKFWFGTERGVSRYDGKTFTTFTVQDGLADNRVFSIVQDREGYLWFGTMNGGVSRYDPSASSGGVEQKFTTFTTKDGLVDNVVWSIIQDREGHLWFGTNSGVSQYDGQTPATFTAKNGLAENLVRSIIQDREGHLWFGAYGGVSQYDGRTWNILTTKDGLADNAVFSIVQDREGYLWFGTHSGVSRYDGKTFTTFTTKDGLAENLVWSILQDRKGHLWFGTNGGGISRYDGQTFTTFTKEDGLADNRVWSIFQDREGYLWFGTLGGGVSRYDPSASSGGAEQKFTTFTTKDGLVDNMVRSILQDREGHLWFGTLGGVSRYNPSTLQQAQGSEQPPSAGSGGAGKAFTTFTREDGLAGNDVRSILQDREGHLWFGTYNGGASQYDGKTWITFTTKDGLVNNGLRSIFQDREGYIWFGTVGGVTRYRSSAPSPPPVFIDAVVADRRYEKVSHLSMPSSERLMVFEFHGISFKTRPEAMIYRYCLKGFDKDWKSTHAQRVEYWDLPGGSYTFEVVAVDRDLTYSEKPATVRLTIHPSYETIALAGGLGLALIGAGIASGYAVKRRRERDRARDALMQEMEKELQTAHEMQMALMPKESPRIEGFDIAGRCIPANHVGGDYFQYFHQADKLTLCLADVTGHAMEAAIPVVMFSGLLKSHMELGGTLLERFDRLNRSLYGTLTGRTLVCLAMGELDLSTRAFSLSDSGCLKWSGLSRQKMGMFKVDHRFV